MIFLSLEYCLGPSSVSGEFLRINLTFKPFYSCSKLALVLLVLIRTLNQRPQDVSIWGSLRFQKFFLETKKPLAWICIDFFLVKEHYNIPLSNHYWMITWIQCCTQNIVQRSSSKHCDDHLELVCKIKYFAPFPQFQNMYTSECNSFSKYWAILLVIKPIAFKCLPIVFSLTYTPQTSKRLFLTATLPE